MRADRYVGHLAWLLFASVAWGGCGEASSNGTAATGYVPDADRTGPESLPGGSADVPPVRDIGAPESQHEHDEEAANAEPGATCSARTIDVHGAVPDMLIVLDRSLSMSLNRRWQPSKEAVKTITRDFGGLMRFGLSLFPGSGGDCAAGQLDVPLMIRNGDAIAEHVDHAQTTGRTPTGPALMQALSSLGDRTPRADAEVHPGYVLLVTDGEPNCQALTLFPDTAQQDAARAAVRLLKEKNIVTYVIGYQIDADYQGMMNELAALGGSARYRPAENADQIVATFREITRDVVQCSFDLAEVPDDPRRLRVQIDQQSIARDASDGWSIEGKTITLGGAACNLLRDGRGHQLTAKDECEPLERE